MDATRAPRGSLLVVVALVLAACGGAGLPATDPQPARPLQVFAVGDSITEADSDDYDIGDLGPDSWSWSADGDGVQVLGGWAHAGATTADMLQGLTDRELAGDPPPPADVLVIMAGNNDVDAAVPFNVVTANLVAIAGTVHAGRVVLSTIAPEDEMADAVTDFNARLPRLAEQEGWQLVDPMVGVGDGRGHYLPGMSDDGVHPTVQGAQLIGAALHAALTGGAQPLAR